jgi:hypothetical protein
MLKIEDLVVESFQITTDGPVLSDEWTGCMSDCGAPACG